MVKFRKPVIVAAMICFSAMMATGCLNPGNTSGTKQYISQNQKKTIETDNLKIKQYIGMKVNCEKENTITDKDVEDAVPEYLAENDLFEKDTRKVIPSTLLSLVELMEKLLKMVLLIATMLRSVQSL